MQERGFLAVVLGPDGAGKTQLTREIQALAAEWRISSLQPDDLYPLDGIPEYNTWALTTHPRTYVSHMRPMTRVSFFAHVMSMAWEYHVRPYLEAGRVVVSDSYWYRPLAKERLQSPDAAFVLEALVSRLPEPDLVLWLDLPLTEAWRRNGAPSTFEMDGDVPSQEAYEGFQRRVLDELDMLVPSHVPQVVVDATLPPREVALAVTDVIDQARANTARPEAVEDSA